MQEVDKQRNMTSIYLRCNDEILLLYRQGSRIVNNMWIGSAGGHFEENELNDATACVLRELNEELSLTENDLQNLALRYVTLRRANHELRVNYYFFADLDNREKLDLKSTEGTLQWFKLDEISSLTMPFTSKYVMEHYVAKGQYNTLLYGGVANGETVIFTELPEF